jgi:acyl carrier protein
MEHKIKEILAEILKSPELADTLSDDAHILNDVGLDSVQILRLILTVEEVFGCELDLDKVDVSSLSSISAFCQFVSTQKTT